MLVANKVLSPSWLLQRLSPDSGLFRTLGNPARGEVSRRRTYRWIPTEFAEEFSFRPLRHMHSNLWVYDGRKVSAEFLTCTFILFYAEHLTLKLILIEWLLFDERGPWSLTCGVPVIIVWEVTADDAAEFTVVFHSLASMLYSWFRSVKIIRQLTSQLLLLLIILDSS